MKKLFRFFNNKNRAILREMVATDFKIRYQGSLLGYAWSVLKPLFIFAILYVVFVSFLRFGSDIPNFPVYLLMGVIFWNFFGEATSTAMGSVVGRGDLIKKINIPKYLIVLSGSLSAIINFSLNMVVLLVIAMINGVEIKATWLLVPIFVVEMFILAIAVGFLLSAIYVKFRDSAYIWEVVLQAGFFATPIIYPLTIVADKYQKIIMLNPMAQIIQDSRWAFVSNDVNSSWKLLDMPWLFVPFAVIIALVIVSVRVFKKQSNNFAENL